MSGAAIDLSPAPCAIRCTQGDRLERFTVDVVRDRGGVETPATISAVVAQVRRGRDRSADLVVDLAPSHAGSTVTFGGVAVPTLPGVWWWDLQVTGTFGADEFDLTVLADSFTIGRDVSHV